MTTTPTNLPKSAPVKNRHKLDITITAWHVTKFTLPNIITMIFMAFYVMVDGLFISNYIDTDALAATNIIYPAISLMCAIAIMISLGGSALIANLSGQGQYKLAREVFSTLTYLSVGLGVVFAIIGLIFKSDILYFLGNTEATYDYANTYYTIMCLFVPAIFLQIQFQNFFITAGYPHKGLIITIIGGLINIIGDYILIVIFKIGIAGAIIATGCSSLIPAIYGIWCFGWTHQHRPQQLSFTKTKLHLQYVLQAMSNGSSEMVTNLSVAITTFVFNILAATYLGANGVAAITIILYSEYLFNAVFVGYSTGIAPIIGYNLGNENYGRLKKVMRVSRNFIIVMSIMVTSVTMMFAAKLVHIFTQPADPVFDLANTGLHLFGIGFMFMGANIFISNLFTALSNGRVSAMLSFTRAFVLLLATLTLLPLIIGVNGIWLAVPIAEFLALLLGLYMVVKYRTTYRYI